MSKALISSRVSSESTLSISEFFSETIQGEGIHMGCPSAFLRLRGCTLQCIWCDTLEVWKRGNMWGFEELFKMMEDSYLVSQLKMGHHFVITGGSPLLQQKNLILFIEEFVSKFGFLPFIEMENECVIKPDPKILNYVQCWNNSPKLSNSGMPRSLRYKPEIIEFMSHEVKNSWFKFVIEDETDIKEILMDFSPLIKREQVILMPEGLTREVILKNKGWVQELAKKHDVRFCTRLHIELWDKTTGV